VLKFDVKNDVILMMITFFTLKRTKFSTKITFFYKKHHFKLLIINEITILKIYLNIFLKKYFFNI